MFAGVARLDSHGEAGGVKKVYSIDCNPAAYELMVGTSRGTGWQAVVSRSW
jgi:tRNA G37 N-methylase Trm5